MLVDGKLMIKLDNEQLDQIVIEHCREAIFTIKDILNLDRDRINRADDLANVRVIESDIEDNLRYAEALNTVIEYFGGEVVSFI